MRRAALSLALRAVDPRHVPFAVPNLNGLAVLRTVLLLLKGSVIVRRLYFMDANEMAVLITMKFR